MRKYAEIRSAGYKKVKDVILLLLRRVHGGVLLSLPQVIEPVGSYTILESMTHARCDARPTVTFPCAVIVPWPILCFYSTEGRRLSWPEWLNTCIPRRHLILIRTKFVCVQRAVLLWTDGQTGVGCAPSMSPLRRPAGRRTRIGPDSPIRRPQVPVMPPPRLHTSHNREKHESS